MKKQVIRDERVLMERQKILSEAYAILMVVLIVSILIQQFLLNAPFEQYIGEFICFFGVSIYIVIRNLTLGMNVFGDEKNLIRTMLINSTVAGIVVATINGTLNYINYAEKYEGKLGLFIISLLIMFVSTIICSVILFALINFLNNKRQKQIQKKLDKEEQGN